MVSDKIIEKSVSSKGENKFKGFVQHMMSRVQFEIKKSTRGLAQHSTAQHGAAQHSTGQCSTAQSKGRVRWGRVG